MLASYQKGSSKNNYGPSCPEQVLLFPTENIYAGEGVRHFVSTGFVV